jgi:hypothetical protein
MAMLMLVPHSETSPEQYWEDYRKLGVTETLDVAAVPVADFLADAPKPTEDQILAYFDTWKEIPPSFPGGPGLRQPRRVRVEYLEADFADAEKEVAKTPITEQEIKKYYDDHKEEYRNRPVAGTNPMTQPLSVPLGPSLPAPLVPKTTAPSGPGTKPPATKTAPAQKSAPPAAPQAPKKDAKGADKKGASNDGQLWGRLTLARRLLKIVPADGEMLAEANPRDASIQLAAAGEEPSAPALPKPPAAKSSATKSAPVTKPSATNPTKPAATTSTVPPAPTLPDRPEPEFRPLDEILQREIRDQILRARTQAAIKKEMEAAYDFITPLREQLIPAEIGATPKMTTAEREKKIKDYAAQHHLKYVLTPLVSAQEFHDDVEKYPIAAAAEPVDVIQQLFTSSPDLRFDAYRAEDREGRRYVYWKTEDVADHVPTLKEAGVREQAIRGWKIAEYSQKKAKERADQLAELVRKSKQSMVEALAGQKVNSKEKGTAVVVVPTPPFSWYTVQSTAPRDMMPDPTPRLSEITGVTDPDEAFMKAVFNEMHVGDVRVVPNQGSTILYVVKVKTRHPEDNAEKAAFAARFLKERLFFSGNSMFGRTTYDYLNMPAQQQLAGEWIQRLFAKYNVRRNMEEERRPNQRRAG